MINISSVLFSLFYLGYNNIHYYSKIIEISLIVKKKLLSKKAFRIQKS